MSFSEENNRYYGRRSLRRLRPKRKQLYQELLPKLTLKPEQLCGFAPRSSFSFPVKSVWLEIGFGTGEHLVHQALSYPDIGFIGIEPFQTGVANLLSQIEKSRIRNILIYPSPLQDILADFPNGYLSRVFVLFPDPWPKKRHHRRRIISSTILDGLARIMQKGAELRIATDHPDYMGWILRHLLDHPSFSWQAEHPQDWKVPPLDWAPTRYEAKARKKASACWYLRFIRRN